MTPEAADRALFGDTVACDEVLRARFVTGAAPAYEREDAGRRGEASLRAVAVIEDSGGEEDDAAHSPALRRIEARLDLVMAMLAAQQAADDAPMTPLRWSARGARLVVPGPVDSGVDGVLRLQAASWWPDPLALGCRTLCCSSGETGTALWVEFRDLGDGLALALERHLFRRHRREIAGRRLRGA